MREAKLKLLHDADEKIHRFTGGSTEYIAWTGKSAALLEGTMAACKKLIDLAEEQKRPFTEEEKTELEQLQLFGDVLVLAGSVIHDLGMEMHSTAAQASFTDLSYMVRKYIAAHRAAYALWRGREEHRLLSRPAPGRPN
jgi:hypothetical protein